MWYRHVVLLPFERGQVDVPPPGLFCPTFCFSLVNFFSQAFLCFLYFAIIFFPFLSFPHFRQICFPVFRVLCFLAFRRDISALSTFPVLLSHVLSI